MKNDIILSGVGGQGILSIATVIGLAVIENNLYIKQGEDSGNYIGRFFFYTAIIYNNNFNLVFPYKESY